MLVQDALTGYLQEVPDYQPAMAEFAEATEPYLAEFPSPGWTPQPWWWRAPYIHWSWSNEWRPWRRPLYGLARYWLQQPFSPASLEARRNAYFQWQQQQGMAPGMPGAMPPGMYPMPGMPGAMPPGMFPMPGMPGMPMPGMPGMMPGLPPGMPGVPGMPGMMPAMASARSRSRRRRRRR